MIKLYNKDQSDPDPSESKVIHVEQIYSSPSSLYVSLNFRKFHLVGSNKRFNSQTNSLLYSCTLYILLIIMYIKYRLRDKVASSRRSSLPFEPLRVSLCLYTDVLPFFAESGNVCSEIVANPCYRSRKCVITGYI